MVYQPTKEKCCDPETGGMCLGFKITSYMGNSLSICIIQQIPDQIKPPIWCKNPNLTRCTKSSQNPRSHFKPNFTQEETADNPENETSGVTPALCPCGCGKPVSPGRKWAERGHRDRLRNKARLRAYKLLWEILLREADLRGYEVRKKGG